MVKLLQFMGLGPLLWGDLHEVKIIMDHVGILGLGSGQEGAAKIIV